MSRPPIKFERPSYDLAERQIHELCSTRVYVSRHHELPRALRNQDAQEEGIRDLPIRFRKEP